MTREINFICIIINLLKNPKRTISTRLQLPKTTHWKTLFSQMNPYQITLILNDLLLMLVGAAMVSSIIFKDLISNCLMQLLNLLRLVFPLHTNMLN